MIALLYDIGQFARLIKHGCFYLNAPDVSVASLLSSYVTRNVKENVCVKH